MHSFIHSMTYVKCEEFLSVLSPFGSVIGCDSSLLLSYLRILFPWFLKGEKKIQHLCIGANSNTLQSFFVQIFSMDTHAPVLTYVFPSYQAAFPSLFSRRLTS